MERHTAIALLLVALAATAARANEYPQELELADPPGYLYIAPNGTSLTAPARGTFELCPQVKYNVTLPMTLINNANLTWLDGTVLSIDDIIRVPGNETHKTAPEFNMYVNDEYRRLVGNGIPNHNIGTFPIQEGSEAYDLYAAQPTVDHSNSAMIPVEPYELDITIPKNPKVADKPTCLYDIIIGVVSQTGAAWHIEYAVDANGNAVDPNVPLPTDLCWGHPWQNMYHYHGYSWKCFPDQGKEGEHSPLFGYALDGFGIYGPRSEGGKLVSNADLDECHGHTHVIDWDGKPTEMYHYHQNQEFPYSVGCYRGTPAAIDRNQTDYAMVTLYRMPLPEDAANAPAAAPASAAAGAAPASLMGALAAGALALLLLA